MQGGVNNSPWARNDVLVSEALGLNVPSLFHSFSDLFNHRLQIEPSSGHEEAFLGIEPHDPQDAKVRLKGVFSMAKYFYEQENVDQKFAPDLFARNRTKKAAAKFYQLAYGIISERDKNFPLYGKNKCIGFVSIPNSKIVIVAISQDRMPRKDVQLRQEMAELIQNINNSDGTYQYCLARLPTKEQYFLLRALSAPISHDGDVAGQVIDKRFDTKKYQKLVTVSLSDFDSASDAHDLFRSGSHYIPMMNHGVTNDLIEYRTRCVEVALMVALNKTGRVISFAPKDVSMEAFSGGLWANAITEDMLSAQSTTDFSSERFKLGVARFSGKKRNAKYTVEPSIAILLEGGKTVYLDYWGPCNLHCQQMLTNMRIISCIGGAGSTFAGPIFESVFFDVKLPIKKNSLRKR